MKKLWIFGVLVSVFAVAILGLTPTATAANPVVISVQAPISSPWAFEG